MMRANFNEKHFRDPFTFLLIFIRPPPHLFCHVPAPKQRRSSMSAMCAFCYNMTLPCSFHIWKEQNFVRPIAYKWSIWACVESDVHPRRWHASCFRRCSRAEHEQGSFPWRSSQPFWNNHLPAWVLLHDFRWFLSRSEKRRVTQLVIVSPHSNQR